VAFGHRLSHLPLRAATGAFILNSGLQKLAADEQTAATTHGFAAGTYPFVKNVEPAKFIKMLAYAEISVGGALLAPIVPATVAGLALTGFSGGLLGLYLRTPGMRQEGSLRPTEQGTVIAKDVWMFGIGLGLVLDGLSARRRKARKKARKQAEAARAVAAAATS
jgi:hypothetical protein